MGGRHTRTVEIRRDPGQAAQIQALSARITALQSQARENAKRQEKREEELRKQNEKTQRLYERQIEVNKEQGAVAKQLADDLKLSNQRADEERATFTKKLHTMSEEQKQHAVAAKLERLQVALQAVRQQGELQEENLQRLIRELAVVETEVAELQTQCDEEEARVRSSFPEEYDAPGTKRLVLLGITGNGKSSFGNRVCGDASDDADQGPFETSDRANSKTKKILAHRAKLLGVELSVVDTPGTFDSDGDDRFHANELVQYLRGCGGVDAFLVFKNGTDPRLDKKYEMMLKELEDMIGREFFHHVIIIATHVEPGRATKQFEQIKDGFRTEILRKLRLVGSGVPMPMIGVGLDQYKEALEQLMAVIPKERYMSESLKGPLDVLREQLAQGQSVATLKSDKVAAMRDVIKQLKERERKVVAGIADLERQQQQSDVGHSGDKRRAPPVGDDSPRPTKRLRPGAVTPAAHGASGGV